MKLLLALALILMSGLAVAQETMTLSFEREGSFTPSLTDEASAQKVVKVWGHSQSQVLSMDGDPNGTACSSSHMQDDLSNRWCHSVVVKVADSVLQNLGMNRQLSAIFSASLFVPKEFLMDKKASPADLVIAEYTLMKFAKNGTLAVSLFGDGATFVGFEQTF